MQVVHSQSQHEIQACKAQIKLDKIDQTSENAKLLDHIKQMDKKIFRLKNEIQTR